MPARSAGPVFVISLTTHSRPFACNLQRIPIAPRPFVCGAALCDAAGGLCLAVPEVCAKDSATSNVAMEEAHVALDGRLRLFIPAPARFLQPARAKEYKIRAATGVVGN